MEYAGKHFFECGARVAEGGVARLEGGEEAEGVVKEVGEPEEVGLVGAEDFGH